MHCQTQKGILRHLPSILEGIIAKHFNQPCGISIHITYHFFEKYGIQNLRELSKL